MRKYQRKIKKAFTKEDGEKRNLSLSTFVKGYFILTLVAFLGTQLLTNAILSPLGHELQSLNYEKNLLVEDNRMLEQEIARDTSLTIIKVYSEDKFQVDSKSKINTTFITDQSIQASN